MTDTTDFIALYRDLGVVPECTAEEFKRAYRRRVSDLHPDRVGDTHGGEEALKALNLGYAAAVEFRRVHGRFPGASPTRTTPRPTPPVTMQVPLDASGHDEDAEPPISAARWIWLVLLVLLAVLVVAQLGLASNGIVDAHEAQPTHSIPLANA